MSLIEISAPLLQPIKLGLLEITLTLYFVPLATPTGITAGILTGLVPETDPITVGVEKFPLASES